MVDFTQQSNATDNRFSNYSGQMSPEPMRLGLPNSQTKRQSLNEETKTVPFIPAKRTVDMYKTPDPTFYKDFNDINEYEEDDWEEASIDESLMESMMESFKGILDGLDV